MEKGMELKILLMDDNEIILEMMNIMLGALGCQVVIARHGKEALEIYEQTVEMGNSFDLLIFDLTIKGGMDGVTTLSEIKKVTPEVAAILISGMDLDEVPEGFMAALEKPFKIDALSEVLQKIKH